MVFLPQEEGQWEEMHANSFFTVLSEKPGIKEDPGVSLPAGTLLDMPLQEAHSLPTPLGGEEFSACSSHHKGDSLVTFGKQLIHKRGQMTSVLTGCINSSL